jgi:hypothetical protein
VKINGGTVSWACRKQGCVSLSTCEPEYVALADTCQKVVWLRNLCKDFSMQQTEPTIINVDNQSCLKLVDGNMLSNRTKHIDTKYHFVKDLKSQGIIDLQYCPSELNVADLLMKPLASTKINIDAMII